MANRRNHYEAAFEAYLRAERVSYIAVDEAKRSLAAEGGSIKNLDFIISSTGAGRWLVDVKGRRFPSGQTSPQYWKNWTTRDDMAGLVRWQQLFGEEFVGVFVFAYLIVRDMSPVPESLLFEHNSKLYAFVAVRLADYARHCRPLSPRWDTVAMPAGDFRRIARPIKELFALASPSRRR